MTRIVIHGAAVERKKDKAPPTIVWADQPDPQDYPAAQSFLTGIMPDKYVAKAMDLLRAAPVTKMRAKDIIRGSAGEMLPEKFPGVQKEIDKMVSGAPTSPLLLVQGTADNDMNLILADGWHRCHALYYLDDAAWAFCKLAKGVFDAS